MSQITSRVSPRKNSTGIMELEPMSLTQARWSEHRKKIGLSYSSFNSFHHEITPQDRKKEELIAFVRGTLKRKECINFVPKKDPKRKPEDPVRCHCGEIPEKHIKGSAGVTNFFQKGVESEKKKLSMISEETSGEWKSERDIRSFPTNAFGKVEFLKEGLGGKKPSKYVRLADNTPMEDVVELMLSNWHMNSPVPASLVITVIGGAKNFKLDGKKREVFNRGLVNAAQTTHAWIITSGCNMGVMKAVGEAVSEGQSFNWDKMGMTHALRCIGIAPWGYVERKENLVSNDGHGSWNATYKVNNIVRSGHPVPLNHDHTHFILVDDGFRGRYGGVAEFRASLERKLSLPQGNGTESIEETGLGIPVVLVVVEGGYDAILDCRKSLSQKIPVIICEGTGRAADIIAYAFTHFITTRKGDRVLDVKHRLILEDKLSSAFGKTWAARGDEQKEVEKFMQIVTECCEDEKLITVFDMNKHEDLDLAILSALLKGQGAKDFTQLRDQLRLALTWNRSDVAEEKIFTDTTMWPQGSLDEIMTQALIEDKVDFVRLLLQNTVVMKEYLTISRLRKLYNKCVDPVKMGQIYKYLEKFSRYTEFTLKDVGRLIKKLIGKYNNELYQADDDLKKIMTSKDENPLPSETRTFEKPFVELFLWAVLLNRQEMAKFLWERCDEAIPSAIIASKIYLTLSEMIANYDSDAKAMYLKNKEEFEKLAVRVLDQCQNVDPEKAAMLIERKYRTWGDMNCLQIAAEAECREFLSTVCCQNSLNLMWKRGIVSSSLKDENIFYQYDPFVIAFTQQQVVAAMFFPPLIFFSVRFSDLGSTTSENLSPSQKLLTFYKAPITKFAANVIFYVMFLLLYSYVILFDFNQSISLAEWILIGWIGTMIVEEIREIFFNSKADTIRDRIKEWWHFSIFNAIDLLVIILAVLGFGLRFSSSTFQEAKTVYCVNSVFYFIRLLTFYSASTSLGPKLVMINRMMQELVLYIMILLVFLLAYGISTNALMFRSRKLEGLVFRDIVYYPYWQIYGELYLEELEGRSDDCGAVNSTGLRGDGSPCPQYSWLVPALTAAYLLIGNVLLLNLLIAIFTHVFDEIQSNSIQIWKYGIYFLVMEYDNKPALAPPFIIFEHIYLTGKWIWKRTCHTKREHDSDYNSWHLSLLRIFEKEMLRAFIQRNKIDQSRASSDSHIVKILSSTDKMAKMLEEDRILEQQHLEAEQNRKTLMKHELVKRRSTLKQMQSMDSICSNDKSEDRDNLFHLTRGPKKYSRWPSLAKIKELKEKQECMKEDPRRSSPELNFREDTPISLRTTMSTTSGDDYYSQENYLSKHSGRKDDNFTKDKLVNESDSEINLKPKRSQSVAYASDEERKIRRKKDKKERKKKRTGAFETLESTLSSVKSKDSSKYQRMTEDDDDSSNEDENGRSSRHTSRKEKHISNRSRSHEEDEIKQLNIKASSNDEVIARVSSVEERLRRLEKNTQMSLYNIEALLRNFIFYQSSATQGAPGARGGSGGSGNFATDYAHGYYNDRF